MRTEDKFDALIYMFLYWIITSIGRLNLPIHVKSSYIVLVFASILFIGIYSNFNRFGR